ncbi:glycosyltransferase [Clostridium carnis]
MKICYLGDANSIHTKKLCYFFRDKGYDVSVISLNKGEIEGVKVYSMDMTISKNKNEFLKINYLKNIANIKKIVNDINPDILHAHYATSYGLMGSLTNYKPYIVSVWGSDVYDFPKKSFIHKSLVKYNLKKADTILSTSKAMAEETKKYTDKEILVTPFGVDINKFKPSKDNKLKDELCVGTIKTLEDKYGIEYLIKGFSIVVKRNPNLKLKLKIAGKGSKEAELKKLCKELKIDSLVEFLGFLNPEKVAETFRSFDVAVFPSVLDSESFGVAAVEAQACGIPVIVSDVGGLMESTKPGFTSLVAKRKNADDLADKLEEILINNELREKMSLNARKYVEDNYNVEDNFEYINKIYKGIIKK